VPGPGVLLRLAEAGAKIVVSSRKQEKIVVSSHKQDLCAATAT
jgi:hypothetical protein